MGNDRVGVCYRYPLPATNYITIIFYFICRYLNPYRSPI